MTVYVFDMDGTLTRPRKPMDDDFAAAFTPWLLKNQAFIATGSDLKKVYEQLPESVMHAFTGICCSMGNILWSKGEYVYKRDFTPEPELLTDLEEYRRQTAYPYTLYPNYIEKRTGALNFSVLGRNCPYEERERYNAWDKEAGERKGIAAALSVKYPKYEFSLGGSISIDIVVKGHGKEQIALDLREKYPHEHIMFFGDRTLPGGNDYALAAALLKLEDTEVVQVDSPDEVLTRLGIK